MIERWFVCYVAGEYFKVQSLCYSLTEMRVRQPFLNAVYGPCTFYEADAYIEDMPSPADSEIDEDGHYLDGRDSPQPPMDFYPPDDDDDLNEWGNLP